MSDENEATKDAVKDAVKEWLNERVTELGWFSLKTIVVLAVGGILWLALVSAGWHK